MCLLCQKQWWLASRQPYSCSVLPFSGKCKFFLAAPRKEYLLNIYNYISSEFNYFDMFDQLDQDGCKLFWEGCLLFPRGEILSFVNHVKDVKDIIIFAIFWPFNTLLQIIKHSKQSYIVNFTKKGLFFYQTIEFLLFKGEASGDPAKQKWPQQGCFILLVFEKSRAAQLVPVLCFFIFYHKNLFENLGHGGLE